MSVPETQVFRTTAGKVVTAAVVVVCAVALGSVLLGGGWGSLVRSGGVFATVGVLAWALLWRPSVEVTPGEIVLGNVLRTVRVPWVTVTGLDSRWSFTVETTHGTFSSWAAPGHSGMGSRVRPPRRDGTDGDDDAPDTGPEGDTATLLAHGNDASAVALAAGAVLARLQEQGHLTVPRDDVPVARSWNVPVVVALAAATCWLLVGLVV